MFAELETPRLRLRPPRDEDAPALFAIRSDPLVAQYNMPVYTDVSEAEGAIEFLKLTYATGDGPQWAITYKEADVMIGMCGFHHTAHAYRRAKVGYDLARTEWGRGVMSEALRAVVAFGFREISYLRVYAEINGANRGSLRVMEKVGFRLEGVLRQHHIYSDGLPDDLLIYGLLASEWNQNQP
jgi:[ribosomal protein S5]-alanine N-acetyltransferase